MLFSDQHSRNPRPLTRHACRYITSLALTLLLVFSILSGSLHHHDDGQDHRDCPVCVAAHHHPALAPHAPAYAPPLPEITATCYYTTVPGFCSALRITSHSRAPPA
ncbi:MAG: DUF2946 family protein [Geobacteraceae bacterium]|nr:DUF2946 family protein [Geobacteraceae bacterium]